MLKATSVDTTPSARRRRRGAALAIADDPGAGLISAQAEMERVAAAPVQTDRQAVLSSNRLCAITQFAAETPAATEAALMAKAMILRRELEVFGEPDESPAWTLALSIVDDLIRLRAPAGS